MTKILEVRQLQKSYSSGSRNLRVLQNINFEVEQGESSIMGPSGNWKTTLLGLCAGLDEADSGSIALCGTPLDSLSEDDRASLRKKHQKNKGFTADEILVAPNCTPRPFNRQFNFRRS